METQEMIRVPEQTLNASRNDPEWNPAPQMRPIASLRKHPRLALAAFLTVLVAGGWFVHRRVAPVYEAESIVYVSPIFPKELTDDHEHDRQYEAYIEQQTMAISEPDVLQQAIEENPGAWKLPDETMQSAVARLATQLKVTHKGRSYLISVSLQSPERDKVAPLVNSITQAYLHKARQDEFFGTDERLSTLTTDKQQVEQQLADKLKEQASLLGTLGMAHYDSTSSINPLDATISKLRDELADAHARRVEADARFDSLSSQQSGTDLTTLDAMAADELNQDPGLNMLKNQFQSHRATLMTQMEGMTPQNPLRQQATAELQETEQHLDQATQAFRQKKAQEIKQRYQGERSRAIKAEAQLESDLMHNMAQVVAGGPKLQRAELLSAEIDRLKASDATIEGRIQSLTLERSSPGSVHLDSAAMPPTSPVKRKDLLLYGAVLLASLLAGLGAAILARRLDPKVYDAEGVRSIIGFPPIGMLLEDDSVSGEVEGEYFTRLLGGIEQALRRVDARVFLFTSVGPGFTDKLATRLGSALLGDGLRTLVLLPASVDSAAKDAAKDPAPDATSPVPSTAAVSSKAVAVSAPASPIATNGFAAVDSGFQNPYMKDAIIIRLPKKSIARFVRERRSDFDCILIAGDPILTSADTENLARVSDGTVLVVNSGETTKSQMQRTTKLLETLRIPGIAVVLRNIKRHNSGQDVTLNLRDYAAAGAEVTS